MPTLDLKLDLATLTNPEAAAEAARILIRAYAQDPQDVDWNDVQQALERALEAFGLPETYPEDVFQAAAPVPLEDQYPQFVGDRGEQTPG